jgi:hypothetical protein
LQPRLGTRPPRVMLGVRRAQKKCFVHHGGLLEE